TKNGTSNLFINGSSSFVGIGTTAPAEQLHVVSGSATGNSAAGLFASTNAAAGTFIGLKGECHVTGGPVNNQVNIGLLGEASCDGSPADAIGVKGTGIGSQSGD